MAILALGLMILGEKTHIGIYFLAACIPLAYLALQVQAFMMFGFSGLLIMFNVFRALHPGDK